MICALLLALAPEPTRTRCSRRLFLAVLATVIIGGSTPGWSDPINIVPYGPLGPNVVDFEDVAGAGFPGVLYDDILVSGGVMLAERFVGQTLSFQGNNDVLSGTPTTPLILQVGTPGHNLSVGTDTGTNGLYPYGFLGFPNPGGYGEGAFAVLFPTPVSQFGLEGAFGDGAPDNTILQFFRADGSTIATVTVTVAWSSTPLGFEREGGLHDIAGVSVHNIDVSGLSYDNLRYDGAVIPVEQDTWGKIKGRYR